MLSARITLGLAVAGVLLLGALAGGVPANAQQDGTGIQDTGVDESRVIIPRAKIIRVPTAGTQRLSTGTTVQGDGATGLDDSTFEVLEIEPIAGSSSGGGVIPVDDGVAEQTVATTTTDGLIPGTPVPPEGTPQVRVISPDQPSEAEANGDTGVQQAALTPEQETGPGWKRKRTRRFKLAPKGDEVIDTSNKPYAVPISPIRTRIKTGARLRQLDKMTGQTITFDLGNGESRRVDRLQISLEACRSPKNNASHGAMAFLKIWDTRDIEGDPKFTGWMFAESPALSALDHPRYDLWVINCTTSEAEVSAVNE